MKEAAPAPPFVPDWSIVTLVVPGTLNVLRIVVAPRFSGKGHPEVVVIGDYVFRPNTSPQNFAATVDIACAAAGRAAAGFVKNGQKVGINAKAIFGVVDLIVEAVRRKTASAIIHPNGERVVEMDEQGIIAGDIAQVLNMAGNGKEGPIVTSETIAPVPSPEQTPPQPPPQVEGQTTPMTEEAPVPEIKLDF